MKIFTYLKFQIFFFEIYKICAYLFNRNYTFYLIYIKKKKEVCKCNPKYIFIRKWLNPLFFIPLRNKRLKKLRVNLDSNYRGAFNLFNTCKFYILSIKKIKKNS